jgi:hypothetical protein
MIDKRLLFPSKPGSTPGFGATQGYLAKKRNVSTLTRV